MKKATDIQAAQLQQLLSVSNVSLLTSALLALIFAYFQREVIEAAPFLAWCGLMALAIALRAALIVGYQLLPAQNNISARLVKFRIGVVLAGIAWGAAGILMFPAGHPQHQMLLVFVLAGMTAGGVVAFSVDLFSAIAFTTLLAMPLVVRLLLAGDRLSQAMALATLVYCCFMILSLRRINRHIYENVTLRLEASEREDQVRASEERYRMLLSHLPVGIFHYDANLVVTYCNGTFADMLQSSVERLVGLDLNLIKDQAILPALHKPLQGEAGLYEGHYQATFSNAGGWAYLICAPFRDDKGGVVGGIGIVQDVTERKQAEDEIKNLAFFDHLTNLPNRRLLLDRLQQAMAASVRSERYGALLFIDLDNFKTLNDTLGHDMGDLLLQQVAQRLRHCAREGDSVARFGGDEFVVMLEDLGRQALDAAAQTEAVGEQILSVLGQPYQLAGHEYRSTPSIGATLFDGQRQAVEELLKQADIAMYQAKKAGRNTLRFFDQQMQHAVTARAALENELYKALELGQFRLHYQVQVDSARRVLGAEALIRWRHPERGLLGPAEFIAVAEESDLILGIGQWVLEAACAQLRAWQRHSATREWVLAVNVSAHQFRQTDFVAQVDGVVRRHGIDPRSLKLELTESTLLENSDETIATMTALRKLGVLFSLDDFGTGYSSLQYLKRLPLDQLKIDRSFVRDIESDSSDEAIIRTIVAMAAILDLDVIAEGVETEAQSRLLQEAGCRHYQGYLFGRPVPIEEFTAAVAA